MEIKYGDFLIRSWEHGDRASAFHLIKGILAEYGLQCDPYGADRDVYEVELFYHNAGGEFWIVEKQGHLVGTAGYYPTKRGDKAVEIRKMYLLPEVRRQGLGKFLLDKLEAAIADRGFTEIWIETASVLKEAVKLYESNGYQPSTGVETPRCDRIYMKTLS
ncbi:acetyltransferase [Oscillatoriales cyanobacterium USR001]|nr:acetyltransferase [Oscillatoriales cyanobacterium USR001]